MNAMRMLGMAMMTAAMGLAVTACGHSPSQSSITKIVISQNTCGATCDFVQTSMQSDGRYAYSDGDGLNDVHGRLSSGAWKDVSQMLAEHQAFFRPPDDLRTNPDNNVTTVVWVEYAGGKYQKLFNNSVRVPAGDETGWLQNFTAFAQRSVLAAVGHQRFAMSARLADLRSLQSVTLSAGGCLGFCATYTVIFGKDGHATIRDWKDGHASVASAAVPFEHVTELLRDSNFAVLLPHYSMKWTDTAGATLTLRYAGFTYVVEAPDRTQWPPQLVGLAACVDQLVLDTAWS
ncbi:MAG: hypothetical protein M3N19_12800, partial [Candidatus Eremiobacteraeota bacterium]|nr:hypothetical protein [Candidatus Eremiobacteraeota bacterium]